MGPRLWTSLLRSSPQVAVGDLPLLLCSQPERSWGCWGATVPNTSSNVSPNLSSNAKRLLSKFDFLENLEFIDNNL